MNRFVYNSERPACTSAVPPEARCPPDLRVACGYTQQRSFRSLQGLRFETLRPTMDEKFKNLSVNKRMEKAERK